MPDTLAWEPAAGRPDLLTPSVVAALTGIPEAEVAPIDPALADTEALCAHYGLPLDDSANCVVVAAKRAGVVTLAACVVLATTRADVNSLVRRHLDARKASFAPLDDVVATTGMEYGGITPVGLPPDWPVLVDAEVVKRGLVIIGSGIRASKIRLAGSALAGLPGAQVLSGLGIPVAV